MLLIFTVNTGAETQSKIGIGAGVSFTGYYDEIDSPIRKYSNALTCLIFGNFEKKNLLHSFNINFFWGDAKRIEPHTGYRHIPSSTIRLWMDYSLNFNLLETGFYKPYIGAAFRTLAHYTGPLAADNMELLNPTGVLLFSLDLNLSHKFTINNRNSVFVSTKIPFLGYAVRPPFAGLDGLWIKYLHEGTYMKFLTLGEFTSFNNYRAFLGDVKYHFKINNRFSVYCAMLFEHSSFNFYRPRKDLMFGLYSGVSILF
jgi:hypothetical protein